MRAVIEQAVTHEALVAAGTAAAHEPLPPLDTPPKPIADLLMQACIACRGFCCRTGGEHAYITPRTIADYRRAHPDAEANDIVATYTSYLPSHAMERACVFQHAQGCTLPREIRGDTCNRFYCGALTQLAYDVREEQTPKAFLIPTNDASFADALFAAPQFAQRVRRRAVRDDESPEPHEKG